MWRRTLRDRVFIAILVLCTVTVLTLDFRTGILDGVAATTAQAFGVLQSGVRSFVSPFESVIRTIGDLGSLRAENTRLRRENTRLRRLAETYTAVERENARVQSLLQLETAAGVRAVHARVIGASLSGLERSATINKGREAGIAPNMAVVAAEGLVGRVVWSGARTAKIVLLTDAQSAVGVRIGTSGETGLARGTGGRNVEIELVSRAALDQGAVKTGDTVLTSGYQGGIYPPNLPVGRVESVTLAPRGTSYTISVRPFARLSQLDLLAVAVGTEIVEAPPSPTPRAEQ
ncbi:MAG TPA: rod shape-determining protein MreC [Actinomycetota bacterium]|jgi:rod shape-determining protein MreC|nr:rod shape-determining protein MreC [Actinomycetota bacterium]